MQANGNARATGHLTTRQTKREGLCFYAKGRLPDGSEFMRKLGPVWTNGKGRPPEGHLTRRMAEAELRRLITDAERGTLSGQAKKTGLVGDDIFAEHLRYAEEDRQLRPSTNRGYRSIKEAHLSPEFGAMPVEEITTKAIEAWQSRLIAEGKLSARSRAKLLVALHAAFRRAGKVWGLPNPVVDVERPSVRRSGDIEVLSPAEVEALARAAESEQDAALFTVAAFTGLRLGELRALTWADVDFTKRLVHVRRSFVHGTTGLPKSGRVRSVPMIDQAARALDLLSRRERWTDDADLVFVGMAGDVLDDSALRRRFKAALAKAKLQPIRLHDLRHSFGTLAVQAFPLSDVKAYMGHADISTTMIYVHHRPQHDAADKLSALVAEAQAPELVAVA